MFLTNLVVDHELQIVKPFLDPKTARKVKFVYSNDPTSMKPLSDLIDKEDVEAALRDENFNFEDYTDQMRLDDAKFALRRKVADEDSKSSMSAASTMVIPKTVLNGVTA